MDGNRPQKQHTVGSQGFGQVELSELHKRYTAGERDFRQVDLFGQTLAWVDLSGADLSEANLSEANLCAAAF